MSYHDLITPTGDINRLEFDRILANCIRAETDLAVCVRHRRLIPAGVSLGESNTWYAQQAAELGGDTTISVIERAVIASEQRRLLGQRVRALIDARREADRQMAREDA